jgi:alpha-L-fucosidase
VVSRGGRLLLNVGPTAAGEIVPAQQQSLRALGRWLRPVRHHLAAGGRVDASVAEPSDEPWVRWLDTPEHLVALVDHDGQTLLSLRHPGVDLAAATGQGAEVTVAGAERLSVTMAEPGPGPAVVLVPKRST